MLFNILTEQLAHGFPVILPEFLHRCSHKAGGVTLEKNIVCMTDAGKTFFCDVGLIEKSETHKRQHGLSTVVNIAGFI
jgi:hypothetical protein